MFRGGFERAIRAPSLQELYNPIVKAGATVSSDPCAYDSSYRTGPNAAQVAALCQAQGVPAAVLPSFHLAAGWTCQVSSGEIRR